MINLRTAPGDKVLHGIYCSHIFHVECILQWMEQCHDHCPYCRVEMLSPQDMFLAASQVLTNERMQELKTRRKGRRQRGAVTHTSSQSNSSPSPRQRSDDRERNENIPRENLETNSHSGQPTQARIVSDNSQEIYSVSPLLHATNDSDAENSAGEVLNPFEVSSF
jgi:Ring finger domain